MLQVAKTCGRDNRRNRYREHTLFRKSHTERRKKEPITTSKVNQERKELFVLFSVFQTCTENRKNSLCVPQYGNDKTFFGKKRVVHFWLCWQGRKNGGSSFSSSLPYPTLQRCQQGDKMIKLMVVVVCFSFALSLSFFLFSAPFVLKAEREREIVRPSISDSLAQPTKSSFSLCVDTIRASYLSAQGGGIRIKPS